MGAQIGKTSSLVLTLCGVLKDILLVCASIFIWGTPVTGIQLSGYCVALAGLVYHKLGADKLREQYSQLRGNGYSLRNLASRKIVSVASIIFILLVVGEMCLQGVSVMDTVKTIQGTMPIYVETPGANLAGYQPRGKFDIVISMYWENQTKVAEAIREIKELAPLQGLDPNVIIYIKDQDADVEAIKWGTGADVVKIIPNRGREGGTYLSHILSEWNNLAAHTLFLQGDIHNFEKIKNRITDYFVPTTGTLPLGFGYTVCECNECRDSWGGDEVWYRVPEVYSAATGELCPNSGILVSYGGQFIVSANRIRSTKKQVYQYIQQLLESDSDHWIHEDSRMDRFNDKPDNPYFGHTLERSWMILFQCADPRLSITCPKLDTRREPGDTDEKCQCIDKD